MISLLLVASLLAPPTPGDAAVWRFPDPYAPQLRAALVEARGGSLTGHLITDAELDAFLAAARPEGAALGCVDDRAQCPDSTRAALQALGLSRRIDATATRTETGWRVTFTQTSVGDAAPAPFTGEGDTVSDAVKQALSGLTGQGSVRVVVVPEGARLLLDGEAWGTGSGTYPARPGAHVLRAELEGRRAVEIPLTVARGRVTATSVELPVAFGKLVFAVEPADATVLLDGRPYAPGPATELAPGDHTLEVSAPGHEPAKHTFTLKPATQMDLSLKLQPARTDWWMRFETPHEDTLRHVWLARADLRFVSLGGGSLTRNRDPVNLNEQSESIGLTGLGFTLTWRSRLLIVDALSLDFAGGAGPAKASFDDGDGEIRDYFRTTLRPAWFGVRYPMWRVEPYAVGGPLLAFDSFDAVNVTGDTESFDGTAFGLGIQLGARFFFTPDWFAHTAFDTTFWFGERATAAFVIGGGYAFDFDLPEWL